MTEWMPDELGDGYEQRTIPLGDDPDGEGTVEATLVRRTPRRGVRRRRHLRPRLQRLLLPEGAGRVLHRARLRVLRARPAQVRPLAPGGPDRPLRLRPRALRRRARRGAGDRPRGDRRQARRAVGPLDRRTDPAPVAGPAQPAAGRVAGRRHRRAGAQQPVVRPAGQGRGCAPSAPGSSRRSPRSGPTSVIKLPHTDAYGTSLHVSAHGEWDFNTAFKPLEGFPVTYGWLTAVRRGHAQLHRGLDIGVPSLVLRSTRTRFARTYSPEVDDADAVLDVKQIARWSGCLGDAVTVVPIEGARHDVFISKDEPRKAAYAAVDTGCGSRSARQARSTAAAPHDLAARRALAGRRYRAVDLDPA